MTSVVKGIQPNCPYYGKCDFDSVEALESHFLSHEESVKKCCPECGVQFSQEGFYRNPRGDETLKNAPCAQRQSNFHIDDRKEQVESDSM
ncbi:hypothetical protein Y032_0891g2891 [Ancylostoma ceylanicum]|nr:hypothetical protein Y032_0891g2891 [Ancylostoma ceylanicum]